MSRAGKVIRKLKLHRLFCRAKTVSYDILDAELAIGDIRKGRPASVKQIFMMSSNGENGKCESVASRKLAATAYRKARKAALESPRNRLLSDSSDEVPKGILKSTHIPTKRSVSECVDDLSQVMADLDLNIHDLPRATSKFCPHRNDYFDEEDEDEEDENLENRNNIKQRNNKYDGDYDDDSNNLKECDCNIRLGDSDNNEKPKKSVRFNERVYEAVFFASKLYDRRYFAKYHFSSRHHPPANQANNNKSKKNRKHSKSESDDDQSRGSFTNLKPDNSHGCKLSKSQRAKQSKKDKKRKLNKKDDGTDTSSDDQGYSSTYHSFSD